MTEQQNKPEEGPEVRCERVDYNCWIAWAVGMPGMLAQGETETEARRGLDLSLYAKRMYDNGRWSLP